MQHHLIDLRLKDGVYDSREAAETFSRGKEPHFEAIEAWAVSAGDRARLWQSCIRCVLLPRGGIPLAACRRSLLQPTEFADIVKRPISSLEVHPTRRVI